MAKQQQQPPATIGSAIRSARVAAGLTQVELAAAADLSQVYVSAVERDAISPHWEKVARILAACGARLEVVGQGGERTTIGEAK